MGLYNYYDITIPEDDLRYVEKNLYHFITNDVKRATGYLAAGLFQYIDLKDNTIKKADFDKVEVENEKAIAEAKIAGVDAPELVVPKSESYEKPSPLRMSLGHLSSKLLGGAVLKDGEFVADKKQYNFAEELPRLAEMTKDYKIVCLDDRYAVDLNELIDLFVANKARNTFLELGPTVLDQVRDILIRSNKDKENESFIAVEFLFMFVKCFGKGNIFINKDRDLRELRREWSLGRMVSRITSGQTGGPYEDHSAKINFGDMSGSVSASDSVNTLIIIISAQKK